MPINRSELTAAKCKELHRSFRARQAGFDKLWRKRATLLKELKSMKNELASVESELHRGTTHCPAPAPRYDRANRRPRNRIGILRDVTETLADTATCAME